MDVEILKPTRRLKSWGSEISETLYFRTVKYSPEPRAGSNPFWYDRRFLNRARPEPTILRVCDAALMHSPQLFSKTLRITWRSETELFG